MTPLLALIVGLASFWFQIEPGGHVAGQLTNGTPNGSSLAGSTVTLASLSETGWQTERTTTTNESGQFQFLDLPRAPGTVYLPIAAHDGAWYYPPQPITLSDSASASVEITVFDATASDEALRYDRSALLIAGIQPESLMVMEMSGLTNSEPRTVIGADPAQSGRSITARFPLPNGAVGFQPQRGMIESQLIPTSDGVGLIWPVFPGRQELAFSYQLPRNGDQVVVDKVLAYPVGTFSLYVPEGSMELRSDMLQPQGATELGGRRYQLYTATGLNRGDRISAQLVSIGGAVTAAPASLTAPLMVAGGSMLLLGGLGAAFAWRRRTGAAQLERGASASGSLDERQKLITEIAALDERFEQQLLPEAAYRETRAALMRRVVALTPEATPDAAGPHAARSG